MSQIKAGIIRMEKIKASKVSKNFQDFKDMVYSRRFQFLTFSNLITCD